LPAAHRFVRRQYHPQAVQGILPMPVEIQPVLDRLKKIALLAQAQRQMVRFVLTVNPAVRLEKLISAIQRRAVDTQRVGTSVAVDVI